MKGLLLALCVFVAPAWADDPPVLVRRSPGRTLPVKSAPECVYVESPWGSPCHVECDMQYFPIFFSDNRVVEFRLITDENAYGPSESSYDFSDVDGRKVEVDWTDGLSWVEWYVREPGEEYDDIPLMGCYCDDYQGVVNICIDGFLIETGGEDE
jgi:hypothetical protein